MIEQGSAVISMIADEPRKAKAIQDNTEIIKKFIEETQKVNQMKDYIVGAPISSNCFR